MRRLLAGKHPQGPTRVVQTVPSAPRLRTLAHPDLAGSSSSVATPINGCMTNVQPSPPTIIRRNDWRSALPSSDAAPDDAGRVTVAPSFADFVGKALKRRLERSARARAGNPRVATGPQLRRRQAAFIRDRAWLISQTAGFLFRLIERTHTLHAHQARKFIHDRPFSGCARSARLLTLVPRLVRLRFGSRDEIGTRAAEPGARLGSRLHRPTAAALP
jgi:hypothetical protein